MAGGHDAAGAVELVRSPYKVLKCLTFGAFVNCLT